MFGLEERIMIVCLICVSCCYRNLQLENARFLLLQLTHNHVMVNAMWTALLIHAIQHLCEDNTDVKL